MEFENLELEAYSTADLNALNERVQRELRKRQHEGLTKARKQILEIAQSAGIPLSDLLGQNRSIRIGGINKVPVRYRHPKNADLQWTGRGRQPKWVQAWIASGQSLDEMRV